jgi:predicted nucleic acid-binding protein
VVTRYHLDTDFLVLATANRRGPEHHRLLEVLQSRAFVEISAIAWYEFLRGPRTPEAVAVASAMFGEEGILAFDEATAQRAADLYRGAAATRRRAADLAIAAHAIGRRATLLTHNPRDYAGIEGLTLG